MGGPRGGPGGLPRATLARLCMTLAAPVLDLPANMNGWSAAHWTLQRTASGSLSCTTRHRCLRRRLCKLQHCWLAGLHGFLSFSFANIFYYSGAAASPLCCQLRFSLSAAHGSNFLFTIYALLGFSISIPFLLVFPRILARVFRYCFPPRKAYGGESRWTSVPTRVADSTTIACVAK